MRVGGKNVLCTRRIEKFNNKTERKRGNTGEKISACVLLSSRTTDLVLGLYLLMKGYMERTVRATCGVFKGTAREEKRQLLRSVALFSHETKHVNAIETK